MSLALSNVLATIAVVALPVVGGSSIAPIFSRSQQRYFFGLALWGIPFAIGQYSQQDEWGALWIQYHLLDLSYVPWGTGCMICTLLFVARIRDRAIATQSLIKWSILVALGFGYASELWDTLWTWSYCESFVQAVDVGDYVTITVGGLPTVVIYLWLGRQSDRIN